MPDDPDPPRKLYGFKPREFEQVNVPTDNTPRSPGPTGHSENDVHRILRENLQRADAAGLNDIPPAPPRSSRRRRDYLLALIAGNLVLAVCTVVSPVFGAAGIILYNVGLAWIVWVVMDPY